MWLWQYIKSSSTKNDFDIPIKNFGRVASGIFRGAKPPGEDAYKALHRGLGVNTIVDLTDADADLIFMRQMVSLYWIDNYVNIPMSDKVGPDPASIDKWLKLARDPDRIIFIHCHGGRHRCSLMVAVYRVVACGWTKKQAWDEAEKFGWYSTWGHAPLKDWFFDIFDPEDYI